ncbi:unnamed protein product [Urochloa humidicola]
MDPRKCTRDRTPFTDVTNATNEEVDAKERKRERDRVRAAARRAAMTDEQRDEINKKRRESRRKNKGQALNKENDNQGVPNTGDADGTIQLRDGGSTLINGTMEQSENDDWLHRDDSYHLSTQISDIQVDILFYSICLHGVILKSNLFLRMVWRCGGTYS